MRKARALVLAFLLLGGCGSGTQDGGPSVPPGPSTSTDGKLPEIFPSDFAVPAGARPVYSVALTQGTTVYFAGGPDDIVGSILGSLADGGWKVTTCKSVQEPKEKTFIAAIKESQFISFLVGTDKVEGVTRTTGRRPTPRRPTRRWRRFPRPRARRPRS